MHSGHYAREEETEPRSCFSEEEIEYLELQMKPLEGKTEKLKNPYKKSDLKRYIWVIARLGGWKGYLSEKKTWHHNFLDWSSKIFLNYARFDTL